MTAVDRPRRLARETADDVRAAVATSPPPSRRSIAACGATAYGCWSPTPSACTHTRFDQLADHLRAGDVLVVNTSATVPGQLDGSAAGGPGRGARRQPAAGRQPRGRAPQRPAGRRRRCSTAAPASVIELPAGGQVELLGRVPGAGFLADRRRQPALAGPGRASTARCVRLPAPARPADQLRLPATARTRSRATRRSSRCIPGSAEMPSAGRPFSPELATRLVARGVVVRADHPAHRRVVPGGRRGAAGRVVRGAGDDGGAGQRRPPARAAGSWRSAPRRPGRWSRRPTRTARCGPGPGWTDLVISPDRPVRVVERVDHRLARPGRLPPAAGRVGGRARADPAGVRRRRGRGLPLARVRRLGAAAALSRINARSKISSRRSVRSSALQVA